MKPARFDYIRPTDLDSALEALAGSDNARAIAGGQTLVPMLAMRLARPALLVDLSEIPALQGIRDQNDALIIGAMTRQANALSSPLVQRFVPLLAKALTFVGHPPTRSRGTVGGSVANADPSAEIGLVLATLGGSVQVAEAGEPAEDIEAEDLFIGPMLTTIPEEGLLIAVRFPIWREAALGCGFHEISSRGSDFAYASAAAQVALGPDGKVLRVALGVGGVGDFPIALDVEALTGQVPNKPLLQKVIEDGFQDIESFSDLHASEGYRMRAGKELALRALSDAIAQAQNSAQTQAQNSAQTPAQTQAQGATQ
jgi:CO/xanthine dehydrogenase FAD-binding subunit